jgi:hypothetical protein
MNRHNWHERTTFYPEMCFGTSHAGEFAPHESHKAHLIWMGLVHSPRGSRITPTHGQIQREELSGTLQPLVHDQVKGHGVQYALSNAPAKTLALPAAECRMEGLCIRPFPHPPLCS